MKNNGTNRSSHFPLLVTLTGCLLVLTCSATPVSRVLSTDPVTGKVTFSRTVNGELNIAIKKIRRFVQLASEKSATGDQLNFNAYERQALFSTSAGVSSYSNVYSDLVKYTKNEVILSTLRRE